MKRRAPTMQQIADAAGVSRMAVSLALRNSPKISAATAQRIRTLAEEIGYRPNPMVSALMTQLRHGRGVKRGSVMAYVTAHATEDGWREEAPFVAFFQGARKRAEALGYMLEPWWARTPGMSSERLGDILDTRHIHGLIVAPMPPGSAKLELAWERFTGATIGWSVIEPAINRASNDQYGSITLALAELTRLGYERIGLAIPAENDERVKKHWSAGMLVHQQSIEPERRVPLLLTRGSFAAEFLPWFREHRPDAVLVHGMEALELLRTEGSRVPEDVGLAHLALTAAEEGWAGIDQNFELVGAAAVDLVDAQLRRNERGVPPVANTMLIPGRWVAGGTVRK